MEEVEESVFRNLLSQHFLLNKLGCETAFPQLMCNVLTVMMYLSLL